MYNKVESAGFTKELTEDFIERYQGNYALTEDGVYYLSTKLKTIQVLETG